MWRVTGTDSWSIVISNFINDLPHYLKDLILSADLYADDTTLYDFAPDKNRLEKNLQHALNLLNDWCLENGMLINIDKTN